MADINWPPRSRWKFGVLSEHQIQIAKRKLAEGWRLSKVAELVDATKQELDLTLWRSFGEPVDRK